MSSYRVILSDGTDTTYQFGDAERFVGDTKRERYQRYALEIPIEAGAAMPEIARIEIVDGTPDANRRTLTLPVRAIEASLRTSD